MPTPKRDRLAIAKLGLMLQKTALTIKDIQKRFNVSQRGAYRMIDYLKTQGFEIFSKRDKRKVYFLILPR